MLTVNKLYLFNLYSDTSASKKGRRKDNTNPADSNHIRQQQKGSGAKAIPTNNNNTNNNYLNQSSNNHRGSQQRGGRRGGAAGGGSQRDGGQQAARSFGSSTTSGSGLELDAELNSVYLPGSKKHNLNHLLNFNYAPRSANGGPDDNQHHHRGAIGRKQYVRYNKEQFLQAICQFVVRADIDWKPYTKTADQLVEWSSVEQVHVQSSEEPQCPICLYHPVAGKMTRCGHVYCWPCVLHYLALSDKSWRKCPICFEAIHAVDLKRWVTQNSNL